MKDLLKKTYLYAIDSEFEAAQTIEDFKKRQIDEGYRVVKSKIDYKCKKDRKTGEVIFEVWNTEITVSYDN